MYTGLTASGKTYAIRRLKGLDAVPSPLVTKKKAVRQKKVSLEWLDFNYECPKCNTVGERCEGCGQAHCQQCGKDFLPTHVRKVTTS